VSLPVPLTELAALVRLPVPLTPVHSSSVATPASEAESWEGVLAVVSLAVLALVTTIGLAA
jgi:hypothetical protein